MGKDSSGSANISDVISTSKPRMCKRSKGLSDKNRKFKRFILRHEKCVWKCKKKLRNCTCDYKAIRLKQYSDEYGWNFDEVIGG